MTKRPRRNHSLAFKAEVAVAAIKGEKTLAELAHRPQDRRAVSSSVRCNTVDG